MSSEEISYRPYRKGDETRILQLFHDVFGPGYTAELWNWQFALNPFGGPLVWLAEDAQGRLAGHYCLIPVPFYEDGTEKTAAFSILSMVHPDFQRRGILKKLAQHCDAQLKEEHIYSNLTFLNDNSLPVYTKTFGWKRLFDTLPAYFTVLNAAELFKKYTQHKTLCRVLGAGAGMGFALFTTFSRRRVPANSYTIAEVSEFDARFDTLWDRFKSQIHSGTVRNRAYLTWRYTQNPRQYRIFTAVKNHELHGFVVVREEVKFGIRMGYIADVLFTEEAAGRVLLEKAMSVLRKAGCGMVSALASAPESLPLTLKHSGFIPLPKFLMPHGIHFCVRSLDTAQPFHIEKEGLHLSWSDHDVV